MSDERPDALLKSALEKIVYFEARAGSLTGELSSLRSEVDRLKAELASASQREIELRRELAEREVRLQRAHADREELGRVNDALKAERAALMGQVLEASRIYDGDQHVESPFDLASFISDLRSEVLTRTPAQAAAHAVALPVAREATVAQVRTAAPSSSPVGHAQRLMAQGRLVVTEAEVLALTGAQSFPGKSEETLFGFSIRELAAPDPSARVRAAERLKALAHPASAAPLATALNAETEPRVQVSLLEAFATVAKEEGAPIVTPLLSSQSPEVRVGALKALMKLSPSAAAPQLSAAMKDPDPAVRRRASLLALGLSGDDALALGGEAIADANADVRALGALVLGASTGENARQLLVRALRDSDNKVRKAAAQSLSRIVGEDVSAVVSLDEAQRRREIRRIAGLPVRPVLAHAEPKRLERAQVEANPVTAAPQNTPPAATAMNAASTPVNAVTPMNAAPAVINAVPTAINAAPTAINAAPGVNHGSARAAGPQASSALPTPSFAARTNAQPERILSESLLGQLAIEVRTAIRGRTVAEVARVLSLDEATAEEAASLLVARGTLVRRGLKLFTA